MNVNHDNIGFPFSTTWKRQQTGQICGMISTAKNALHGRNMRLQFRMIQLLPVRFNITAIESVGGLCK